MSLIHAIDRLLRQNGHEQRGHTMTTRHASGFTLIELVIAIAIVAILAAIALPSYQSQMRKSRRSEAISAMQDAQLRLERWRVDHASFAGSGMAIPNSTHYQFAVTANAATPNNYSVTATPQGDQASDECGTLTLSSTAGVITKTASTGSTRCW